ncbi:MAG TPA: hypothetical protein VLS86_08045, partial [Acidimicrobiia bacterium]|nr:hypothetical protein [Acidimicrobiia bacterium]
MLCENATNSATPVRRVYPQQVDLANAVGMGLRPAKADEMRLRSFQEQVSPIETWLGESDLEIRPVPRPTCRLPGDRQPEQTHELLFVDIPSKRADGRVGAARGEAATG